MQVVSSISGSPQKNGKHKIQRNGYPKNFQWNVEQYYQMADLGFFEGRRVELIEGEIVEMAPIRSPHAVAIGLLIEVLNRIFGEGYTVRPRMPVRFSKRSEPEPDLAVVKRKIRDFSESHPGTARLIVEVSNSTLRFDRTRKAKLYAKYGIPEYWILNLKDRCLEVHRNVKSDETGEFFYSESLVVDAGSAIAPLAKPKSKIKVADILP
jgi:Uma2 family endonuclease